MEDVFKTIADIIKPNERQIALKDLQDAINALEDVDIKIDLLTKLSKYIITL